MRIVRTLRTLSLCVMTLVGVASCADADNSGDRDASLAVAAAWDSMTATERGDACFRWELLGYEAFVAEADPAIVSAYARLLRAECER